VSHKQGFRVELAPTEEQAPRMGRHCGLSRVVENFCLETVRKKKAQQEAEKTYGITGDDLTKVPWSAPALEKEWRVAHPERFPWFAQGELSSRVPKAACRVRAAGIKNYFDSKNGNRKGAKLGWPKWRKRKHGSRFRYDADRAKPLDARTVRLPAIGDVATREDMSWLTDRMATGHARILGGTVREQAGRWWVSFQLEVDREDINKRHQVPADALACGIDLGLKTFAVIRNSDGTREEIHAPKPLKAALRALQESQPQTRPQRGGLQEPGQGPQARRHPASAGRQPARGLPAQDHHQADENQVRHRRGNPARQGHGQEPQAVPRRLRRRMGRVRPPARLQG